MDTNLDFLLEDTGRYQWTRSRSGQLLGLKKLRPKLSNEEIAKKMEAPAQAIRYHLAELRRAARSGLSFEQYWDQGRPLRTGKEKIIPGKYR